MVEALRLDDRLFNSMFLQQAVLSQAQVLERNFQPANLAEVTPPPGLAPPPGLEPPRKVSMDSILEASSQISDGVGTQLRENGSVVSYSTTHSASQCETNSLGSIAECKFLLEDLHQFRAMLLSRLSSASQSFQPVDEELAVATRQVCVFAEELMTEAERLAMDLSLASQNEVIMLKVYGSTQQELAFDAVAKLGKLRSRTRMVRSDYLFIMERLRYVSKCVEAVWDNSLDLGQAACISDLLELGLNQIDASVDFLQECSDFWIMLHKVELQLPDLKEGKRSKLDKRRA